MVACYLLSFACFWVVDGDNKLNGDFARQYGSLSLFFRQMTFMVLSVLVCFVVAKSRKFWRDNCFRFGLALLLLVMVLIPGIGQVVNGSRR